MTKADKLWERYATAEEIDGHYVDIMSEARFMLALQEYGEAVMVEAVKACVNRIDPHPDNAPRNAIIYDSAAAIVQMKLP